MSIRYLDLSGAVNFWTNIKNYILSKIPTKTSELTNDSGFLTQHQSLSNYVTLNSNQTITAIKTITGGNQGKMIFKNPNFTVGTTPESATTVTRIYFGGGASYDGSTGAISNDIASNGNSQLEICALNNNSSNSYRTSLILRYEQDQTRPRFIKSWGDFCPYSNDTYYLGRSDSVWKECYCNAYYLGTTAFGDIVTHNASEFLTSHQSLSNYVTLDGTQTITGVKTLNSDTLVANQGNAYRIANSAGTGYGVFQRTDGTYWYMLVTANNDPLGTWTSARPITIRLSDGYCTINGKANEANKVQATIAAGTTAALVQATVASNDCFRIAAGGAANAGWAEIATGDDANEPIYVRQYKGNFTTLQRTATLLDGSGNTSFPGTVTATGFSGPLTGDVTGNAATSTQFSANTTVALTGDATGTSAGSKKGWSVPVTLANSGVTAGTYGPSADVTGNNNATISVPEITVDAKGRVTSVTNRTYTSVNTDTNTDTKVTQTVTTANSNYPVLLCATADATATGTTTSRFSAGLAVNTRYSSISMTNKYDTANTKGVRDSTKGYLNGDIIFKCYDASEMGRIHCESSKNGYQQTYMQARSYIKNGAISPEGTATTCYITVRVRDNGSKTIYTDGSWENSLTPYANETYDIGTSSLRWMRCYCKNFYGSYVDIAGRYLENEYSTNARTCLYLKSNRDTDGKSGIYFSKFRQNRAQGALTGSDLVCLTLDVLENSVRTNGCIAIDLRYFENDVPTKIYVIPKASMTSYMGTADNPWTNVYGVNFYENGTALSDKYLTVSAISGGASTSAGNITPVKGTIISGFADSNHVTYSTSFGGVLTAPSGLYYATCVYNTSTSAMEYFRGPSVGGTGTWKLMGGCVQNPGSNTKLLFGLWIKIV